TIIFRAAGAKDVAIGKLHGFVFDRTEDAIGQAARLRPGLATVGGSHPHPPPRAGAGADFVEEHQRPGLWLEQDRIPARVTIGGGLDAVGDLDRRGPLAGYVARKPDADVWGAFASPPEPGRHKTVLGL